METKGTEIPGRILDDNDREWYTRDQQQFVSRNQEGEVHGHYMQVDGKTVTTDAMGSNEKTLFKTHTVLEENSEGGWRSIVILENKHDGSVVAINEAEDSVIAKTLNTPPSDFKNLEQVKTAHPEILFYKMQEQGSRLFYFKSLKNKDKQLILGFKANGDSLNPAKVQPSQNECLFHLHEQQSS